MMAAGLGGLPFVLGPQQAPARAKVDLNFVLGFLSAQFVGLEGAAKANIVGHPDRLIEPLSPNRDDLLDRRPGADAVDPDPLVSV